MPTLVPAFAYTRVSSSGQQDGHGPKRQLDTITRFARKRFEIAGTFHDAHTGTEVERPAFAEMVAAIKANGVRTIIIESLDRLARELTVQQALLSVLQENGIALYSASTGQNITDDIRDDPMRAAMVQVQGVFAEVEKKLLVRKMKKARDEKRENGGHAEGQLPFGAKEGEKEVIDLVLKLRKPDSLGRQRTLQQVAAELDRREIKPRRGEKWSVASVWQILNKRPSRAKLAKPKRSRRAK